MLLICLIAGTVLVQFLVLGWESPRIEILDNMFPASIPDSEKSQEFNLGLLTGRDFSEIEIRFCILIKQPLPDPLNTTLSSEISPDDLADIVPAVSSIKELMLNVETEEKVGELIEIVDEQVKLLDGSKARAVLYDFGQIIDILQPEIDSRTATSYLVIQAKNGTVLTYAEGVSDYFFSKWTSIKGLTISKGEEKQEFYQQYFEELGLPTIVSAPPGRVIFDDVDSDTKINVYFSVLACSVPNHRGMYQVIRVYGDRELQQVVFNPMTRGAVVQQRG